MLLHSDSRLLNLGSGRRIMEKGQKSFSELSTWWSAVLGDAAFLGITG